MELVAFSCYSFFFNHSERFTSNAARVKGNTGPNASCSLSVQKKLGTPGNVREITARKFQKFIFPLMPLKRRSTHERIKDK